MFQFCLGIVDHLSDSKVETDSHSVGVADGQETHDAEDIPLRNYEH